MRTSKAPILTYFIQKKQDHQDALKKKRKSTCNITYQPMYTTIVEDYSARFEDRKYVRLGGDPKAKEQLVPKDRSVPRAKESLEKSAERLDFIQGDGNK